MTKKEPSSEVFYWDAPRKRLHKKDLFPLQIEINGQVYFASQWTINHFKIIRYSGALQLNKEMAIKPIVKFRDFEIQFVAKAIPLRYDPKKKELIASFKDIPEEHQELLAYFSEALNTGDMVNIDNVLRRVDMPITPASTQLVAAPQSKSKTFKRGLIATLYLVSGISLVLFTLATLYKSFFRIEVKTAFITAPMTSIQSKNQGTIKDILISKNEHVKAGQALMTLDVADSLSKQRKLEGAKQQVSLYTALLEDNKSKTNYQIRLNQTKLTTANTSLQSALLSRRVKCNRRYATEIDRRNPQKRGAECLIARKDVTTARLRINTSRASLVAAKKGYKNNSKETKSNNKKSKILLEEKLKRAKNEVESIENTSETFLSSVETIFSPISGKVLNIIDGQHQYLKKGQLIALIQKDNSEQYIEAHLTHKEVADLKVGDRAVAYSPLLKRDYSLKVEHLDFTKDVFSLSQDSLFKDRIPQDKTAKAILKFTDKKEETLLFALPVELSIEKDNPFTNKVKESFTSFLDLFINKTQANHFFPDAEAAELSECKNASRLFPEGIIKNIQEIGNNTSTLSIKDTTILDLDWKKKLLSTTKKLLQQDPTPVDYLQSSGITSAKNKALKKTRIALRNSKNSALLAIAYYLTGNKAYLAQSKKYVFAWATTHIPNGHPINETRLEGFLWAYDLLYCHFTKEEHKKIKVWLMNIQSNKHLWKFGPTSRKNNLRTHQLKILLMVDHLLNDDKSLVSDRETLLKHADNNILDKGVTIDYKERDALHYHVYDLEPWLEIALLEPDYKDRVNSVYSFLVKQLKEGNIHNQFANSKQKIDAKRAAGGFSYAKKGGTFDTTRITRSVLVYSTLNQKILSEQDTLKYLSQKKLRQYLFQYARYYLWKTK